MLIECAQLQVSYAAGAGQVVALESVSLTCERGEIVSIIGPSGCGKSTLLRVIAGLREATDGEVRFGGGRPKISLVFQEGVLYPWLTALENAAFGLEAEGVTRPVREQAAAAMLARMGLGGREGAYPGALSAGMRQRVALARSFLTTPELLLMDEPFAALDALTRLRSQRDLLEMWQETRPGVIFVTHDVNEAIAVSHRIVLLSGQPGRVVGEFRVEGDRGTLKAALLRGLGVDV